VTGHRAIARNAIKLAFRQGSGLGAALGFVLSVLVLVPLSIGPDQATLQRLAPGLMWLTLLLAVLMTADRIFAPDLEDGTLELMVADGFWLVPVAFAKAIAHWLSTSLPLAILTPILGLLMNISAVDIPLAMLTMSIGSLALSMLAAFGGAIVAGLKRGGLLVSLLVLPLYIPVLIFGVSAVANRAGPAGSASSLLLLAGITLMCCVISPWASAAALRVYLR
jgi:heme exporter protein B